MNAEAVPAFETATANEKLKQSFGNWFWGSVIAATLVHFAVFSLWPDMTAADIAFEADELEAIELPPEIEIPPPPEAIARPATPVISDAVIEEDITIAPTTFEDNPVEDLPPPPDATETDVSAAPTFTPFTVRPDLKNTNEVRRALEREYPPLMRDAGIGGTVNVWFFINEEGRVLRNQVQQSSGHKALDDAALKVADIMEFTPALNRDKRVQVWVAFPITFTTN